MQRIIADLVILALQYYQRRTNLEKVCGRYQLSNRVKAAITTSLLNNLGMFTDESKLLVIDSSQLRRKREKCREEIRREEVSNFTLLLYFIVLGWQNRCNPGYFRRIKWKNAQITPTGKAL